MNEPHVVSALRKRRSEIGGYIADLERKINRERANLAHIDATIRLFSPGTNPDAIQPKRAYRRTRYFRSGELSKLTLNVLRATNGEPTAAADIAGAVMLAKGLPANDDALAALVVHRVLTVLRRLAKRGAVVKTGKSRDAQWALTKDSVIDPAFTLCHRSRAIMAHPTGELESDALRLDFDTTRGVYMMPGPS